MDYFFKKYLCNYLDSSWLTDLNKKYYILESTLQSCGGCNSDEPFVHLFCDLLVIPHFCQSNLTSVDGSAAWELFQPASIYLVKYSECPSAFRLTFICKVEYFRLKLQSDTIDGAHIKWVRLDYRSLISSSKLLASASLLVKWEWISTTANCSRHPEVAYFQLMSFYSLNIFECLMCFHLWSWGGVKDVFHAAYKCLNISTVYTKKKKGGSGGQ